MAEGTFADRFRAFRPSKTMWFWSTLACIIVVVVLGFTWGGWVTAGSAADQAETAAKEATTKLAADICAHRFLAAPDAATQLAALQKQSSYERDDFIEKGGWATFAGAESPMDDAASLCAKQLADAKPPATTPVADATSAMGATSQTVTE